MAMLKHHHAATTQTCGVGQHTQAHWPSTTAVLQAHRHLINLSQEPYRCHLAAAVQAIASLAGHKRQRALGALNAAAATGVAAPASLPAARPQTAVVTSKAAQEQSMAVLEWPAVCRQAREHVHFHKGCILLQAYMPRRPLVYGANGSNLQWPLHEQQSWHCC